ncbi:hypothetical protein ILP86_01135 [Microbacterium sp. R1]|uniref:hypothetical protein n=1 Tax=Microbacterium sp. R1 TaxID=322686 RepID=UPI00187D13FF|nr:hypothetical protein [Microbacterium sp. R1]MBE7952917.1 hypothetical protein [Microbacterium sp. R1]
MIPLGPQLIGQTEKALNALLLTLLSPHALSEREWVTLRLVSQFEGEGSVDRFVADRLHDPDSALFLRALQERGLVEGSHLSPTGTTLVAAISREIARVAGPIWDEVDHDDALAAARALNHILEKTRLLLRASAV